MSSKHLDIQACSSEEISGLQINILETISFKATDLDEFTEGREYRKKRGSKDYPEDH